MQLLEGDGLAHGISVVNGQVSINFLPLVSRGLQELSDLGVPGLDKIPELTPDGDPTRQIAHSRRPPAATCPTASVSSSCTRATGCPTPMVSRAQELLVVAKQGSGC